MTNTGGKKTGTVRIYLLPKYDERHNELNFLEQRELAIELDKFNVNREWGMWTKSEGIWG